MGKLVPQVFDKAFVNASVQFVFYIALPCLVVKGIGVGVDFYSEAFLWKYIACFLILRVFALVLAILSLMLQRKRSDLGIGDVAVRWLALTWISTVILGVPILTAVFGDAQKGAFYGLLAGISSFVFQLPFQLFFFECHKLDHDRLEANNNDNVPDSPESEQEVGNIHIGQTEDDQAVEESKEKRNVIGHSHVIHGKLWRDILIRVGTNPVIWGIMMGFLISLSTFGKRFLRPRNDDKTPNSNYLPWLQFFVDSLTWFGDCVSPVSLFSMGIWMQMQGRNLISIGIGQIALFMISKLILVPFLMIGLAKAFQL
jgi:predicted permease